MGIFQKIKDGLKKTKDSFGRKIFEAFQAKELNDEFYEELEYALISADMGVGATDTILEELRDTLYRKGIRNPADAKGELKRIMKEYIDFEIPEYQYPMVVLVAGVNGVGKTTAIGKLAKYFTEQKKSVVVAAADTFRAAASDQLEIWAQRAGVRIIKHAEGADPAAVVSDAVQTVKAKGTDVLLVDTAGRLHNKKNLMEELKKISRVVDRELPEADRRNYIVLDATTGQNAVQQVSIFDEAIDIDGIILTKLDGTAKGGVVLQIAHDYEMPVVFVGVGEGIDDLLPFDATEFVDAIF